MRVFWTIIILTITVSLYAQENQIDANGLRQGLWQKKYPNSRLMYEGWFKDGKPVGKWKRYHEGGQLKALINYDENSDTAHVQLFNPYGKKVAEGNYVNEKKSGKWIMYSQDRKIAEENYTNGVKNGLALKFYDSGEILESSEWKNGKQDGKYEVFYKNGKPYMQCKFSNDKRNGLCLTYFQNGRIEMEAKYINNLRDGDWKYYDENGEFLYTLEYDEGKLLNPAVRDSIDNLQMQNLEKNKNSVPDPEKFMEDPTEYMRKMNIFR